MRRLLFLLLAITTHQFAISQEVTYTVKPFSGKKIQTFNPSTAEESYMPKMESLESPYPSGNSYRMFLKDQKKKGSAIAKQANKTNRSSLNTNSSLNPIIQQEMGMKRVVPVPSQDTTYVFDYSGGTPLDNTIAFGKNGILLASVNSFLWGYDTFNDSSLFKNPDQSTRTIAFGQFADTLIPDPNSSFPFDPKLIYDHINERYIYVFLDGRGPSDSQCIIGFSTTSDPRDPWNVYSLPGDPRGLGANWTDYPAIAITEDELFFTVNMIIPNVSWQEGFDGTVIWQIELENGYNGEADLDVQLWDNIAFNNEYVRYLCPVEGAVDPEGPNAYFVSNRPWDAQNDTLFVVEVTNTIASGQASLNVTPVKSNVTYGIPPNGKQANTPAGTEDSLGLQTNDARFLGAVLNGNTIHAVGNTRDFTSNNAGVYHATITNVGTSSALSAVGHVIATDTLDLGYPKIAYPSNGTQYNQYVIGFNHTFTDVNAGISCIVYDAVNDEYSEIFRLKDGLNYVDRMAGAYERWGDYFGIQNIHYAPGRVWTGGFYGLANRSSSTWFNDISLNDSTLLNTESATPDINDSKVYPNPIYDLFYADFVVEKAQLVHVYVVDMNGKTVVDFGSRNAQVGKNRFSFNSNKLPAGFYIINGISNNQVVFQEKIVRSE